MVSRMFGNMTMTVNPLAVRCKHGCPYKCWALGEIDKKPTLAKKYNGPPHIVEKELRRIERADEKEFIFICSMTDMMGPWVPAEWIQQVMDSARKSRARVQFCTKNPSRYADFDIIDNAVYGATVETDLPFPTGNAPNRIDRLVAMTALDVPYKMIAVEPYMKWSPGFARRILFTEPTYVHVGADNYKSPQLVGIEPSLTEVRELIKVLRAEGITVFEKTIREAR